MGIQYFKSSDHSPEAESALKFTENVTLTTFDRGLQAEAGSRRLLPVVYVVEKGKPYSFTAHGPCAGYVIEGEYQIEDQSTPGKPIHLTKGDVAICDEGTVANCSSPSMARVFAVTYIEAPKVITDTLCKPE